MKCVQSSKSKWNPKKIVLFETQIDVYEMEWISEREMQTIDLGFSDSPDLSMVCHFLFANPFTAIAIACCHTFNWVFSNSY